MTSSRYCSVFLLQTVTRSPSHASQLGSHDDSGRFSPSGNQRDAAPRPAIISVKKAQRYGLGVTLLKLLHLYVAIVLCGYFVAFAMILLLQFTLGVFLAGITSEEKAETEYAVLSLLSLPIMLQSLATLINLFTGFLRDGWNDFDFLHSMTFFPKALRDWISLAGLLLVPLATCVVSLLVKAHDPVANTLMSAFWCTVAFYALYTVLVLSLQMAACVQLIKYNRRVSSLQLMCDFISLRAISAFSITRRILKSEDVEKRNVVPWFLKLFYVDACERVFEFDRYGKVTPYATEDTPSILYVCCLLNQRMKGRIKYFSLVNSAVCMLLTTTLIWFWFVAFLVYNESFNLQVTIVLSAVLFVILFGLCIFNTKRLRKALYAAMENRRQLFSERGVSESYTNAGFVLNDHAQNGGMGTPVSNTSHISELEIDFENTRDENNYRTYIVAQPRLYLAIILSLLFLGTFIVAPVYAFWELGVRGYGALYIGASCLYMFHLVFDVKAFIEILGPKAQYRLEQMYLSSKEKSVRARRVYLLLTRLLQPQRGVFFLGFFTIAIIFALTLASLSLNEG